MMTITILGVGNVGSQIAFSVILSNIGVDRIDLIDIDKKRLCGEMNDLKQAAQMIDKDIRIECLEEPRESDFYIITAGKSSDNRESLLEENRKIVEPFFQKIAQVRKENSVVLITTNPSYALAQIALNYVPIAIPMGNILDNARLQLCKVNGKHEKPDIQGKYLEVKENKGYTSFGPAVEVLYYLTKFRFGWGYGRL